MSKDIAVLYKSKYGSSKTYSKWISDKLHADIFEIGHVSLNTLNDYNKIIFVSGRISCEMILKAAKAGIPIVISKSAPTNLSREIAQKLNITLAGFVRGERMNIYTEPQRIIFE